MKDTPAPPQNAADIAREAFRRLAMQRTAPTPDAYRTAYNEIAGIRAGLDAETVLADFAKNLAHTRGDAAVLGVRFNRAIEARDWRDYAEGLSQLIEKRLKKTPPVASTPVYLPADDSQQIRLLRELLTRTLIFAVASLLAGSPELVAESESLAAAIKDAQTEAALNGAASRLKQLCFRIELKSADRAEQQELLLRLFRLLLDNVRDLLEEDSWLRGQIDVVQSLISGPINHHVLEDATRSLKEVIYKQGTLKNSLAEAKITVKNMVTMFIDRLNTVAVSTGDYHEKMDIYSQKIAKAGSISELNSVLDDVMRDTRTVQTEALNSRDEMLAAQQKVQGAEAKIHKLESQLAQMSELAREDPLTGSLNRRGLDDVFEREQARAKRRGTPLCVALLDMDDFKRLNDTHGHGAGDEALIYVVKIIKETLRTMDVIGRFGGEEFMVVLPDTSLQDALRVVARLKKELTKRIFMHNNQRLLITFSAGVALSAPDEDPKSVLKRADAALYQAKKAGKNRAVAAD
ncbi:GGDEF domain-containing protein [Sulfuriferula plumbiphila]|uniref:diguanylate cyclase n=1 Tax=Sulfuriferula plumbiphila TaxID=171865 RepID=A0A512L4A0_9PROT|nr:GGDEF domain-containing protein [Sulfuriferula plumbiphila]BBP03868.1 GGDEF domain-containing protein [Sulfuriferula plumbiphila]GEP29303.1 GGDEF domain-containing protein [Sulfuriferula plumbiphila]